MIDLNNIQAYQENNRIEAKRATGGLPHSIWETYSAFANTLGGVILLGVEEWADKSLHPVDLPDPEGMAEEFWALVNTPSKASVNLLSPEDVELAVVGGKHIIAIHVPPAPPHCKPIYVDGDLFSGSYCRTGEGDYRCTQEEIREMLRQADACAGAQSPPVI